MMKLSIILPCYNVSKYISRCLDSIFACKLAQDEYEVICVDDCSKDNTVDLIQSYQQTCSNLQLIRHAENRACGGARNTGLAAAKGEYVWYVDPDDMICAEQVAPVLDNCMANQLDVLCFNYEDIDEQENVLSRPIVFKDSSVMEGTNFAHACFGDGFVYHFGYIVRFFYRRQFLLENRIIFPEHTCWQDTVYMPEAILKAHRVQGLSNIIYRYWHHDTSVWGEFSINYSGVKIFQWVFNAGYYLLQLSKDIQSLDSHYSDLLYRFSCSHYFNQLPLFLFRTSASQRSHFYQQIKLHPDRVAEVYSYLNWLSKFLLYPLIGSMSAHILSAIYKLSHKKH